MAMLAKLQEQVEELRGDQILCKRAVSNGALVAKEVSKLDRFFEAMSLVDERAKVHNATMCLTDVATLWWRRRHADMEWGSCTINTWDDLKREIKRQFYLENVDYLARKNLK
ncbi:hypothetical protein AMTR_s00038p00194660 [Amborella trichopoda]|uniref:Retrotransposon gag domain-containing protein n=1 Tax=Amborella trichopoda TaxID=13333 RepID=U5D2R4_AMBTC|nr:hypothetical protein AMTR_s00038p00194660 [Amborella trichopoda]